MSRMTVQRTMRLNLGNWTFFNSLGYMVAILDTLVEKGAVALELTFVILVIILAKELKPS